MWKSNVEVIKWSMCIVAALSSVLVHASSQMSCTYGQRGSLTVFCTNATSTYFKRAPYRFDQLDETLKCVNCTLNVLELGTFDISGNQIKTLDISNSSITRISERAFLGLIFMEKLILSDNPISSIIPGAFYGVRKVKYLELENAISILEDDVFKELRLLQVLILSKNRMLSLPGGTFNGLSNLKILDLSFNQLAHISESLFQPLASLRILKLQNNEISQLDGHEFSSLRGLFLLNLDNNNLANFTMDIDVDNRLRILHLARNRLNSNSMKIGAFQNLSVLEELYLGQNNFQNIPPKFFQGLYRLRILDLSDNQLKEFTTGTFSGLPHLLTLNLSDNNLESARVSGRLLLHSLHTLDLSNNLITTFDYIDFVSRMPRLTTIYLMNNYLPCETMYEIQTLFEEDGERFLMSTNYSSAGACKATNLTGEQILMKLMREKYNVEEPKKRTTVWVILLVLIILLVTLLFYIEFFILNRTGPLSYRIRIMPRQSTIS